MSIIFNSADIAETMNNGVSNVTGADSIITENYTNVVHHGIKIDMAVREKTISGTPPLTFNSNGTPLLGFLISGNMKQAGTPTPQNPIQPSVCGDLETSGAKAGQYKIPISSANITTPVYLGEVPTTRKIKKVVFDGTETWTITAGKFYYTTLPTYPINWIAAITSHFEVRENISSPGGARFGGTATTLQNTFVFNYDDGAGGITAWKSYLAAQYAAGTPVTVWYVLLNEETGIVNEPLRKIGDYADTLSMEQASVTIPTAVGSNTLDVQTTLKPSNISITYKGR